MDLFFLFPTEATYISKHNPNDNFGPCEKLYVGQTDTPTDSFRTLLRFDIRKIPQNYSIEKATLRLFLSQQDTLSPKELFVNRLISNFSQNTVTWNNSPEFKHTFFSTIVSEDNISSYIYVNITELVKGWYSKTIENNGILLSTLETEISKMEYFGFEDEVFAYCPSLLIEYTEIQKKLENKEITGDIVATDAIMEVSEIVSTDLNSTYGDSLLINTPKIIDTSNAKLSKIASITATQNHTTNKSTNNKVTNLNKNVGKGSNNRKNNAKVANNKNCNANKFINNKREFETVGTSSKGSIIPFASGGPIFMTTINEGIAGNSSLLGFGNAAIDVPLENGTINLMGSKLEPTINFAFSVPRAGRITSISACFSNIVELTLINSTVSIYAQIFKSSAYDNVFYPIQETNLLLTPSLTRIVSIGTLNKGALTNLSIDVNIEDRLLLVFFAAASGVSLINTITGYASAGLSID